MSLSHDPYRHHPELRGKIANPMESRFRQIDLSALDEKMRLAGEKEDWRISDEKREASRRATLSNAWSSDLWLFGYGSLIWDPGVVFDEVRVARLEGFHRRFCIRSLLGRGSPEHPGLMVGLDRGGSCVSLAFRISKDNLDEETRLVWQREMLRRTYEPTFVSIETKVGVESALTFVVDQSAENYMSELSPENAAQLVATGRGFYGASLDYVENLAAHLNEFGIQDPSVCELLERARVIVQDKSDPT